jgi:hypothetical protein
MNVLLQQHRTNYGNNKLKQLKHHEHIYRNNKKEQQLQHWSEEVETPYIATTKNNS